MSINYFITNLLNIKDENLVFSDGIHHESIKGVIYSVLSAKLMYSNQACPHSGCSDRSLLMKYGFKASRIRFSKAGVNPVLVDLKKQKMFCKNCNSYFLISSKIVDKHCCISNQVKRSIFADLSKKVSMKEIAFDNFVSPPTVSRVMAKFDNAFNVDFNFLPKHLCFDEFKSTKDVKASMSFIYCDADTHKVIDVLENRQRYFLKRYFSNFPKSVRDGVESICIDMYSPYISLIEELFVNAKIVIDRFHIVQLFSRSFNQTRVNVMKDFSTYSLDYKRLKKYWKSFLKPFKLLDPIHFLKQVHFPDRLVSSLDIVEMSLSCDEILKNSYDCYQCLREDLEMNNFELFKKHLEYFRDKVSDKMKVSIDTCFKNINYIENTFYSPYSNGPIEGSNNFIKVLKRVAFGYRKFVNFRTRIFITRNLLRRRF